MKKRYLPVSLRLMIIALFAMFLFGSCFQWYLYSDKLASDEETTQEEVIANGNEVAPH